ncbi:hypothetical protein AR457_00290 [Streptomyces agglomeratus]|uniref:hypothetical protein n=1 Tax=Streptomyces agglomeratus TaxID=285458 RepID=UPI0008545BA0|nr:hypothetical protein [Streptomyces agglomeratus]OEJ42792.1 hypothetical protein AR457_00290 [Streptomyces agglomeratus]
MTRRRRSPCYRNFDGDAFLCDSDWEDASSTTGRPVNDALKAEVDDQIREVDAGTGIQVPIPQEYFERCALSEEQVATRRDHAAAPERVIAVSALPAAGRADAEGPVDRESSLRAAAPMPGPAPPRGRGPR